MVWIVGVIVIMMAVAFLMTSQYILGAARENMLQRNENVIIQIEEKAADFSNMMENIGFSLAYSPTTLACFNMAVQERFIAIQEMDAVFSNIMLLENDIVGIYLYDQQLTQIASTGAEIGNHAPALKLHKVMTFSNLFTVGRDGKSYYFVYFPVYDLNDPQYGTQLGMCVFLMKTDRFDQMLSEVEITKYLQIYLADSDDRILATNMQPDVRYVVEKLKREGTGFYVEERQLPINGWKLIYRIERKSLYKEAEGRLRILTVTYLLMMGMIGLVVCFFYYRMINPIRCVDAFIKRLAENAGERMPVERRDEIGTVINSLNRMMDDVLCANEQMQISQRKMYEEQLLRKELQILAYRNQINPHFLYNTFECIRAMALYYEVEDIAEITMALSNVFRFAVKGDDIVSVDEEVKYIREYATIIEYRFMGKIDINIEVEPGLGEKRVMKLMLQPLVENAVFHGLERKLGDGEVAVSIRRRGKDRMLIEVEDDGCGMDEQELSNLIESLSRQTANKGIGIANIYQRLRFYYGDAAAFHIVSRKGEGTKITIDIPDHVRDSEGSHMWEGKDSHV